MNFNCQEDKKRVMSVGRLLTLFALAVILLSTSGCENKVHTKRGSINGRVVDSLESPVAGAIITSHRSLFKAETDEQGRFEFTSLDVGSHRLTVERQGYYLASKTVEIAYGEVLEGAIIVVEPLEQMITHYVAVRESSRVVIDVACREPMSILIGWREKTGTRIQLPPTEVAVSHQLVLTGLFPGSQYLYDLEGTTADGRRYLASAGSFRSVPTGDLPGAPDAVAGLKVAQSSLGPVVSWEYSGVDPVSGFRVFRAENDTALALLQNESNIFADQRVFTDETAVAGRIYRYAVQAVDLDGNISSMSQSVSIMPAGRIDENLTWKKAWSPISVNGDLIISAGKTLTIEPGCIVRFAAEDSGRTGYRPLVCEFIIEGALLAKGSEDEPIKLISASAVPSRSDWDGLRFIKTDGQPGSVLEFVQVAGAERALTIYDVALSLEKFSARFCLNGVSVQGASGTVLTGMTFEDCGTALSIENSWYCSVENFKASDCNNGIILAGNSHLTLKNFELRNIREIGLQANDRLGLKAHNGLVQSLSSGLQLGASAADIQYLTVDALNGVAVTGLDLPMLKNCIIVNLRSQGSGTGIDDLSGVSERSYVYNNIYGFAQATQGCDQLGAPILNLNPMFFGGVWENYDYRLQSESPLLTAADNNTQPGAYGRAN